MLAVYVLYIVMCLKKVNLFPGMSKEERPRQVKILILEKLPEDNYQILKYIVQFLSKVSISSECLMYTKLACETCFSLQHLRFPQKFC
jgi:Rho GTPase-activating protein 1